MTRGRCLAKKFPQSQIERGENRLSDALSRRWQGEKTRLDDFLTSTRIREEREDADWLKEGDSQLILSLWENDKGKKDKKVLGWWVYGERDDWLWKIEPWALIWKMEERDGGTDAKEILK